jgi:hypothetical protein
MALCQELSVADMVLISGCNGGAWAGAMAIKVKVNTAVMTKIAKMRCITPPP